MGIMSGINAAELGIDASGGLHAAIGLCGEDYLAKLGAVGCPMFFVQCENDPDAAPIKVALDTVRHILASAPSTARRQAGAKGKLHGPRH